MRPIFETPGSEYTPHSASSNTTAFILTGGKSQRMGYDKALLAHPSGGTLIEHAIGVAAAVAGEVRIVGPRERYADRAWAGEVVEDIYPDRGPLAGIHAALASTKSDWNIILGVDLPGVTPGLLRWMLAEAQRSGATVTVAQVEDKLHPLCGIYRKSFKKVAEEALKANRNKIAATYDPNSLRVLTEAEFQAAGFSPDLLTNVNTPEEFERFSGK